MMNKSGHYIVWIIGVADRIGSTQQHLEQYVADTRRMNALAAKNWVVLPAWQSTVLDQAELHRYFSQVAAALEHAGAVDFLHPRMDLWTLSGNPELLEPF